MRARFASMAFLRGLWAGFAGGLVVLLARMKPRKRWLRCWLAAVPANPKKRGNAFLVPVPSAARSGIVPASVTTAGPLAVAVEGRVRWNDPELAAIDGKQGSAAAMAEAYARHGDACLRLMSGPFAVAIIDGDGANGLIAVDRMGRRTMCYANPPGRLVFGTTTDNVCAHPAVGRRLSEQAIFNYLYCHVVPSPGTVFTGIQKLRPGECVRIREGIVEKKFYWHLHYEDDAAEPFDAMRARFRAILSDAVSRAIDDDVDVGAFLSGGTDSSTVAGLLTELRGRPAKTYSIGFVGGGIR